MAAWSVPCVHWCLLPQLFSFLLTTPPFCFDLPAPFSFLFWSSPPGLFLFASPSLTFPPGAPSPMLPIRRQLERQSSAVLSQGAAWQQPAVINLYLHMSEAEGEERFFYHLSSRSLYSSDSFSYPFALATHFSSGVWPLWDYSGNHKVGKYCFNRKMQLPLSMTINFTLVPVDSLETFKQQLVLACLCKHLQGAHMVAQTFFSDGSPGHVSPPNLPCRVQPLPALPPPRCDPGFLDASCWCNHTNADRPHHLEVEEQ